MLLGSKTAVLGIFLTCKMISVCIGNNMHTLIRLCEKPIETGIS